MSFFFSFRFLKDSFVECSNGNPKHHSSRRRLKYLKPLSSKFLVRYPAHLILLQSMPDFVGINPIDAGSSWVKN